VDHAVAGEPVIAFRLGRGGVGADPQVTAVEFGGIVPVTGRSASVSSAAIGWWMPVR